MKSLAALLLLLLTNSAAAETKKVYTGEIMVSLADNGSYDYVLNATDGFIYKLVINDNIKAKTGDRVNVTAVMMPLSNAPVLFVEELNLTMAQFDPFIKQMSSITFTLTYCGKQNVVTPAMIRSRWFDKSIISLQKYYDECSFHHTTFTEADNIIIPEFVEVPCYGTYKGGTYNLLSSCGSPEIYALTYYAEQYAISHNIKLANHKRRILILPPTSACGWMGLGNVGCGQACTTWMNGNYELDTVFHELGHTMGLQHATTPDNEYGDGSCAMGGCCNVRCFNAPQASNLNWVSVLYDLSSLAVGDVKTVTIPSYMSTNVNYVKFKSYYFSFRTQENIDIGMRPQYINKLSVHFMDNPFTKTKLLYLLGIGESVYLSDVGLKITVNSIGVELKATFCNQYCSTAPPKPKPPVPPVIITKYLSIKVPLKNTNQTDIIERLCPLAIKAFNGTSCRYDFKSNSGYYYNLYLNTNIYTLKNYIQSNIQLVTKSIQLPCEGTITGKDKNLVIFRYKASLTTCNFPG